MTENTIINEQNSVPEIDVDEALKGIELNKDEDFNMEEELEEVAGNPIRKKIEVVEATKEAQDLYDEFSGFLETKADIVADKKEFKATCPTGIEVLDAILGGGFAIGGLNIVVGQPGSGKTMLAIQAMGNAQKVFDNPISSFLDSEEATTSIRLSNLGVNNPKVKPIADLTIEKVFKFLETLCLFKEKKKLIHIPSVVTWDSIANTLSQKEREAEDPNTVIGYKARLLSLLIPKYVAKCAQYNICFIAVNQLRDTLAMGQFAPAKDLKFMSHTKDMPGGTILKYNAFHLVEMKVKSATDYAKLGFDGIIVKTKCVKNKLFPPNVEIELVGDFLTGFSNFWTNWHFLVTCKRAKTGAWNYLPSYPEKKFRTKDVKDIYDNEPEFKAKFDQEVKDAIKAEILDKYNI